MKLVYIPLTMMAIIWLTACTQPPAPVENLGSRTYSQSESYATLRGWGGQLIDSFSGQGYASNDYSSNSSSSYGTSSFETRQEPYNTAASVTSVGSSDLAPLNASSVSQNSYSNPVSAPVSSYPTPVVAQNSYQPPVKPVSRGVVVQTISASSYTPSTSAPTASSVSAPSSVASGDLPPLLPAAPAAIASAPISQPLASPSPQLQPLPSVQASAITTPAAPIAAPAQEKIAAAPVPAPAQTLAVTPAPAPEPTKIVQTATAAPVAMLNTPAPAPVAEAKAEPVKENKELESKIAANTVPQSTNTKNSSQSQFIWPVNGSVISKFGKKGEGYYNDGINISAEEGEPIWAAADGSVVYAGNQLKGYGNMVIIRHESGFVTTYAHASKLAVKKDSKVRQGDLIGYVGSTGNVEAAQLHFGIREGTQPVDPERLLSRDVAALR